MQEHTVGTEHKPKRGARRVRNHEGIIHLALESTSSLTMSELMDLLWADARLMGLPMPKQWEVVRDLRSMVARRLVFAAHDQNGTRYILTKRAP